MRNVKRGYSGMTIIEMLVAIAIFALGIGGFSLLLSKTWQINSYTFEMGRASMEVSRGVSTASNYIRKAQQGDNGAYPIVSADGNDLILYSDYNKDEVTERLHFYKSGQDIFMGITNPTDTMPKTYPTGDQTIVHVATHIVNDASTPIFYYYNKNYPSDAVNNPLTSPIDISTIRLIKVYFQINIEVAHTPDNIEMQTLVGLRNLND